jgi:sec-independent protein translocase protein TatA
MASLGSPELIIVLVIVLIVFGVGRVSRIGGELGSAIREFRTGLSGDKKEASEVEREPEVDKVVDVAEVVES